MRVNNDHFNNKRIGFGFRPFCIAEVGINHNGDIEIAKKND